MKVLSISMQLLSVVLLIAIMVTLFTGHVMIFVYDAWFVMSVLISIALFFGGAWIGEYLEQPMSSEGRRKRRSQMNNCRNGLLCCVIGILVLIGMWIESL